MLRKTMADIEPLGIRFEMRATKGWLDHLDEWRSKQKPIPSRAEAIRRLVERGLTR